MVDQPKGSPMDHVQLALDKTAAQMEAEPRPGDAAFYGPKTIEDYKRALQDQAQLKLSFEGQLRAAALEQQGMQARIDEQEEKIAALEADLRNKQLTIDFQLREYNKAEERAMQRLAIILGYENFKLFGIPLGAWIVAQLNMTGGEVKSRAN